MYAAICRHVGQYLIGNTFGRGSFGTVKIGKHTKTDNIVALKKVKIPNASVRDMVELEIKIQRRLRSPRIAQLIEVNILLRACLT